METTTRISNHNLKFSTRSWRNFSMLKASTNFSIVLKRALETINFLPKLNNSGTTSTPRKAAVSTLVASLAWEPQSRIWTCLSFMMVAKRLYTSKPPWQTSSLRNSCSWKFQKFLINLPTSKGKKSTSSVSPPWLLTISSSATLNKTCQSQNLTASCATWDSSWALMRNQIKTGSIEFWRLL